MGRISSFVFFLGELILWTRNTSNEINRTQYKNSSRAWPPAARARELFLYCVLLISTLFVIFLVHRISSKNNPTKRSKLGRSPRYEYRETGVRGRRRGNFGYGCANNYQNKTLWARTRHGQAGPGFGREMSVVVMFFAVVPLLLMSFGIFMPESALLLRCSRRHLRLYFSRILYFVYNLHFI